MGDVLGKSGGGQKLVNVRMNGDRQLIFDETS